MLNNNNQIQRGSNGKYTTSKNQKQKPILTPLNNVFKPTVGKATSNRSVLQKKLNHYKNITQEDSNSIKLYSPKHPEATIKVTNSAFKGKKFSNEHFHS